MAPARSQDTYTITPNAFGGYEVQIAFATGEVRRQGRFTTEAAAQAWIDGHQGWHLVRKSAAASGRAGISAKAA